MFAMKEARKLELLSRENRERGAHDFRAYPEGRGSSRSIQTRKRGGNLETQLFCPTWSQLPDRFTEP